MVGWFYIAIYGLMSIGRAVLRGIQDYIMMFALADSCPLMQSCILAIQVYILFDI
jgi:hypothetical protein